VCRARRMLSANFSAMVELGDDVLKPFLQVWWRGGGGGEGGQGGGVGWGGCIGVGWGGDPGGEGSSVPVGLLMWSLLAEGQQQLQHCNITAAASVY
jgi:hypothetical protein